MIRKSRNYSIITSMIIMFLYYISTWSIIVYMEVPWYFIIISQSIVGILLVFLLRFLSVSVLLKVTAYISVVITTIYVIVAISGEVPSNPDIPRYPGILSDLLFKEEHFTSGERDIIIFYTKDAPSEVLGFYRNNMEEQNWILILEENRHIRFLSDNLCPVHSLDIVSTPTYVNQTQVTITVTKEWCM